MQPVEFKRKRHLRNEFIKSGATLLLALVLLVVAVLAWFRTDLTATIEPFYIAIITDEGGVELGKDVVTEKSVVLPAATKLGDEEISVFDFSNAIYIMPLEVESPLSNNVSITVNTTPGLHYYIDTDYDKSVDNAYSYSEQIIDCYYRQIENSAVPGNDSGAILTYDPEGDKVGNVYKHMVAVVFWADYHHEAGNGKTYGQIIDEEGELNLTAMLSFKVVFDAGE